MSTKQEVVARLVGLKLTDEQANKIVEILRSKTKFYDEGEVYNEEEEKDECEDDGFIHIVRGHKRFVFFNGQDKGCLRERDVPRFARMVDKAVWKVLG